MPPDVQVIGQLVDRISKAAARVLAAQAADAISRADFVRFCSEVGRAIAAHCDRETAEKLTAHILSVRV